MKIDLKLAKAIKTIAEMYIHFRIKRIDQRKEVLWNNLFISNNKFKFHLNENLFIFLYKDSLLAKNIYNGFEENEILFLRRYLKDSDTFIDIGSNIGLFSLNAAQIVGKNGSVIAFEPTPLTFKRLVENIELNHYEKIIHAYNIGISEKKGNLSLNVSENGYDAWNTFANQDDPKFSKRVEISVDTLDAFLEVHFNKRKEEISLIKIDVEGWERHVLNGAKSLLITEHAPVLMVEFTESNLFAAGTSCFEIYDMVVSFGYQWYTFDSESNLMVHDPKRIHYPYDNLFAIKNLDAVIKRLNKNG